MSEERNYQVVNKGRVWAVDLTKAEARQRVREFGKGWPSLAPFRVQRVEDVPPDPELPSEVWGVLYGSGYVVMHHNEKWVRERRLSEHPDRRLFRASVEWEEVTDE